MLFFAMDPILGNVWLLTLKITKYYKELLNFFS